MKIRVIWPGKTRQKYLREAIEDYTSRISKLSPFEIVETREESRTDRKRIDRLRKESRHIQEKARAPVTVVLDSEGKSMTSLEFSQWLERQSADVDFLLGGPEGLQSSDHTLMLRLGSFTMPHELARVVLLEQIYRALTIIKRIPYHK